MKHEYHEGPEAKERFEKLATRLFRVPKSTAKKTAKPAGKPKKTGIKGAFLSPSIRDHSAYKN